MSASIAFRKKSLSMDFVKRTAGLISGAAGDYITESMPTSTSTLKEAKATITKVSSTLTSTSQDVLPKIRNIKSQNPMRAIYRWYMDKENEFDDSAFDTELEFDSDVDASEIADAQIGEVEKSSNKVAKAVVESSRQMVESQIATIANLQTSVDKQTAVISAGFDRTNETLNKILEVLTKNTSTLIETTAAVSSSKNPVNDMMRTGKFNAGSYKKLVTANIKNSPEYAMFSMIPMLVSNGFTPDEMIKTLFSFGINKAAPNLKKNMKALDDAVNDTIMHSLIRLGNSASNSPYSASGFFGKLFGIDTSRKTQSTSRSSLEVKSVSFDTITRESITNTIPGYLRKILVALGGEDVVYDYRSRSFKSKGLIKKEFADNAANYGSIYSATSKVRKTIGTDPAANMFYEMLLTRLGNERDMTRTLESFKDRKTLAQYMNNEVINGIELDKNERKRLGTFINQFANLADDNNGIMDVRMQASKNNLSRNSRVSGYIQNADLYNVDLSHVKDSVEEELKTIAGRFGKTIDNKESSVAPVNPKSMTGVTYTNAALYQIFRRLDTGINVFQVGSSNDQADKFDRWGDDILAAPARYKPKNVREPGTSSPLVTMANATLGGERGPNLLQNQVNEDGTVEDLTTGQRASRWAKQRGKSLQRALFSGSPDEVRAAFGSIISDLTDVAGDQIKKGASKIDSSFGNVTGYLKHKMFGTDYSYETTDENGNTVIKYMTSKNQDAKGGIFGFITDEIKTSFTDSKNAVGKWMDTVKSYFNYGDTSEDSEDRQIASKRKKLIFGSVGTFAGAGILGGPIGMLVGALAGNALASFGLGNKLKNLLFGHDEETGKPTGIISKATDAIVSPLKFQLGKTAHFLGASLQKNILGPLSDIGMAIKDRITDHVDSVFDKIRKSVGGFFGRIFGGLGKAFLKVGTGIASLFNITVPGKAARGAIGIGGGLIGGAQNLVAGGIAKNSYHRLRNDETYTIRKGEKYKDVDGTIKKATADMTVTGSDGIKPYSQDYIKNRRKSRNADIKENLKGSQYYASGGLKGFFGGDYKAWREEEWKRNQERRDRLGKYLEEREKTPEELAKEEEARQAAQQTAESTAEMNTNLSELTYHATHTDGEHSIFTHDHGLHERLDNIISIITGKKPSKDLKIPTEIKSDNGTDEFASSAVAAAASLSGSGDEVNSEESRIYGNIIDEAAKPDASKRTVTQRLKELMTLQKKKTDDNTATTEKKESIFEKITNTITNGFNLDGIGDKIKTGLITGIAGFVGFSDLKSFYDNVIKGDMNFSEWWGEESKIGKAINGLMDISKFIGSVGGPIVNTISGAIESVTAMIPFVPKISPPKIDTTGPLAGLATGILGGLYLKGISGLGSMASAAASLISSGSNILDKIPGSKGLGSAALKLGAVGLAGYSYIKGPEVHENTNAAGNEIVDEDVTRGMRMPGTRVVVNSALNTLGNYADGATDRVIQRGLSNAGITASVNSAGRVTYHQGGKFATNAAVETATNMTKNEVSEQILKSTIANADEVVPTNKAISFVKKAFDGMKNFLMKNKTFSKFAKTIASKFDDILVTLSKNSDKVLKKLPTKVAGIITKGTAKEAAGAATLGIGYAVMAFGGALSGGLSAANIFGVREKDVDGSMRTIASVIVSMLNAVPGLWALELADIIMAPMTVRSFLCQLLYNLLGGSEDLAEKQSTFSADLNSYNSTFNTNLSIDEYNDMTNKGMFAKIFGKGGVKTDSSGRAMFDEAGEVLRTNHGVAGWFAGGEKIYAKDENGKILKDKDGKAIQAIDKDGHKVVKDKTWTDHIGNWFHDAGQFIVGKTEYELDENGNVVYDENNKPVVKGKGKNVLQRTGDKVSEIKDNVTATISNVWNSATKKVEEVKDNITASVSKGWETAKDKVSDAAVSLMGYFGIKPKDAKKSVDIVDKKGEMSSKNLSKITEGIKTVMNPISSIISNPLSAIKGLVDKHNKQDNEVDENGKPVIDADGKIVKKGKLGDVLFKGITKITSFLTNPIQSMLDGAKEWEKSESPWKKSIGSGVKTASDWLKSKATNLFNTVSGWFNVDGNKSTTSVPGIGGIGGPDDISGESIPISITSSNITDYSSKVNELLGMYGQSSQYGWRTINGEKKWHNGIDLTKAKNSDVPSFTAGTVTKVANDVPPDSGGYGVYRKGSGGSYGNMVVVKDDNGNYNYYAHLNKTKVNVGDRIQVGQPVGLLGHTGNSTGAHLHYEVRNSSNIYDKGQNSYNPLKYLSNMYNTTNIGTGYTYGVENVQSSGPSNSTAFGKLITILKNIGSGFLNKITGGLFGKSGDSSVDINSQSYAGIYDGPGSMVAASMLDPEKPIELLTNAQMNALNGISAGEAVVIDLKSGISYKIFWGGKPGQTHTDYSTLTPDDTEKKISAATSDGGKYPNWTPRPCILMIGGHQIAVGTHNYNHGSIIGGNPGPKCPNMPNSKPSGQSWPAGGHYCMYYKDSVSNANGLSQNAKDHQKAAAEAYTMAKQMIESLKKAKTTIADSGNGEGIYDYLRTQGYTPEGAAGVLGNLYAESGFNPKNLQGSYEKSLGHTDESYTNAVDSGKYTRDQFTHDSAGYGLAQWTYHTLKQKLYDAAKAADVSIGNLGFQSAYLANELSNNGLDSGIKHATDPSSAAKVMMLKFERPADQSTAAQNKRAGYAINYYNKYKNRPIPQSSLYTEGEGGYAAGGPEDDSDIGTGSSIFSQPKYVPNNQTISPSKNKSYIRKQGIGGPDGTIMPKYSVTTSDSLYPSINIPGGVDNDSLQKVLYEVLLELRSITKNTGSSSDLLGELNAKEFVDQGLRNSINSLNSNRSKSSAGRTAQAARTNTRAIAAMARP